LKQSFDDIEKFWITEVENYAEKDVELLLIGNKCDVQEGKAVSSETAQVFITKTFSNTEGIRSKKKYGIL